MKLVLPLMPVGREEELWNSEQAGLGPTRQAGLELQAVGERGELSPEPKGCGGCSQECG